MIPRILIFEGPDLAGKTTLVNQVTDELVRRRQTYLFRHFGILPESWDYSHDYIQALAAPRGAVVVLDRFTDSEIVYGNVYRDGPNVKFGQQSQDLVYGYLNASHGYVVYCHADRDEIKRRFAVKSDEVYKLDTILRVANEYELLYQYDHNAPEVGRATIRNHWWNEDHSGSIGLITVDTNSVVMDEVVRWIAGLVSEEHGADHAI